MNHDPFKINEAILDMWRDLKAGDDYIEKLEVRNAELVSENARLKAEVERLRLSAFDKKVAIEAGCYARVNLESKVERLIKAGDGMADAINGDYNHSLPCVEDWQAAKEGKPSV